MRRAYAKLSLGEARRIKIALPRGISEAKAREMAAAMAEEIAAGTFVPPPPRGGRAPPATPGELSPKWFGRFCLYREASRDVPIELALRPLLASAKEARPYGDKVLRVPPPEDCAELLRKDLLTAGVDRRELHGHDERTHQITFHALRDTYCTWRAVRGDAPIDIMTAAGRESFSTTQGYLDVAKVRRAGGGYGETFGALPEALTVPLELSLKEAKLLKSLRPQRELKTPPHVAMR